MSSAWLGQASLFKAQEGDTHKRLPLSTDYLARFNSPALLQTQINKTSNAKMYQLCFDWHTKDEAHMSVKGGLSPPPPPANYAILTHLYLKRSPGQLSFLKVQNNTVIMHV